MCTPLNQYVKPVVPFRTHCALQSAPGGNESRREYTYIYKQTTRLLAKKRTYSISLFR